MKRILIITLLLSTLIIDTISGQSNEITMKVMLNAENHELQIQQEIVYHNKSSVTLDTIYLHNWANSFKDNKTPLAKRLIEDYNKDLYFAKEKNRGHSTINNLTVNFESVSWIIDEDTSDIIAIPLNNSLNPNDSIKIYATYTVKLPADKFTSYGHNKIAYNLRYWYLTPAFYDEGWKLMSNLNMDDLLMDYSNYKIAFTVPEYYTLSSDLNNAVQHENGLKTYHFYGDDRIDIEISLSKLSDFEIFNTNKISVETNIPSKELGPVVKSDILNRELAFIEKYLGEYPHKKIMVNNITYAKNPVYGFNQLPQFLSPFPDAFEWDIKMFKALTRKYIDNTLLVNHREDMWLVDGIQAYLMMHYVEEFYPEIKAMGNISKIWGVRSFNIAKLDFNDKYPFVYQFSARKNYDQALTTQADSLSNFNRKIVNKYKAGLGLRYLDEYLGDTIIPSKIKEYYSENQLKYSSSSQFKELVVNETDIDLTWFFGDYVQSSKKIDYTIKKVDVLKDSIEVTIKNKRNMTAPVALYGVKGKDIHFKQWVTNIDSITKVTIPKNGFDRLSLNYEYLYPELNLRDNWKRTENKLFVRPLKFKFFKDIENPYYNEIFYTPVVKYNYYDGIQLGVTLSNKSILKKNFIYKITPYYGFKDKSVTGSFSAAYQILPENSKIYKYLFGVAGSTSHYGPDLSFRKFTPFVSFNFNRKSLRDVGGSAVTLSYTDVNRDLDPNGHQNPESNKYGIFNANYTYSKPEIIQDLRYTAGLEVGQEFSKLTFDFRYRKLTNSNRQFDFRLYLGTFLHNNTTSDFFSFGLSRQSDYLFRYNYFGRSEDSGFFYQQYITAEGGFKSDLEQNFANQWITSFNSSIGIWRWIEVYNDIGFIKNRNQSAFFAYENGIRLNFIHEFLELYFPVYSNNGWEVSQKNYSSRIRFVLTIHPRKIINFVRRGFY
ncbi:MAG: aminopeptidase [Urechidicola sp.]|nr:aminopeptidase [Urechidicola sp.]